MLKASQHEHHETDIAHMPALSMLVRLLAEHTAREVYAMADTSALPSDQTHSKEEPG